METLFPYFFTILEVALAEGVFDIIIQQRYENIFKSPNFFLLVKKISSPYSLKIEKKLIDEGPSINDVTAFGWVGYQGFCENSNEALVFKSVMAGEGLSKIIKNCVTSFIKSKSSTEIVICMYLSVITRDF